MLTKVLLMPAIILAHITGGEVATVYDIPGPHWFNSLKSCQSVAQAGNQNLHAGRGEALHIISVQSYFSCRQVELDNRDKAILHSENSGKTAVLR